MTPVNIKICVLDACMFAAYLYGCECWSLSVDEVKEKILAIERKMLKMILQVKPSTPDQLIYVELGRGNVMCRIKQRQKRGCNPEQNNEAVHSSRLLQIL